MADEKFHPLRVCDLNDDDRPREKAWERGIDCLSDAELIALILGGGLPGMSVLDLAKLLLADNENNLFTLKRTSIQELVRKYNGIGKAKAVTLAAAFELGSRAQLQEKVPNAQIRTSTDVYEIMRSVAHKDYEEFWILSLARNNTVKAKWCVSQGGTAATVVDVKLVMKWAIDTLADSLILVHNHPSGSVTPSPQDDALTRKLQDAANMLDIKILDHVIIGHGNHFSYADQGKM